MLGHRLLQLNVETLLDLQNAFYFIARDHARVGYE